MTPWQARDKILGFVAETRKRDGLKAHVVVALNALEAAVVCADATESKSVHDATAYGAGLMLIAMANKLPEVP